MRETGRIRTGRDVAVRLALAVTPPRFLRLYQERATFRRQVRRATVWAGIALLAYAFLFADGGLASIVWRRVRIRQLQHEVVELEHREAWLQRELGLRQDDREMIERLARERYGMAYPGEKVYRIVEVSEAEARRVERDQRRLRQADSTAVRPDPEPQVDARR